MYKNSDLKLYIAVTFPEYKKYMREEWFYKESYYDKEKDVRLIPKERYECI